MRTFQHYRKNLYHPSHPMMLDDQNQAAKIGDTIDYTDTSVGSPYRGIVTQIRHTVLPSGDLMISVWVK